MSGKIRCIILCKNRGVKTVNVNAKANYFRFQRGIYNVDREAVNLTVLVSGPNPVAELIYFEGDPRPFQSETNPVKLLDTQLIENALKQSSAPRGIALEIIRDYLKDPVKLIPLMFAAIIFIAFIRGLFQ